MDGNYKGLTPFIVDDITQGWHRLTLRKTGYYEVTTWLQFTSDYMLYQTSMVEITGFLQVEVFPPDSIVTVGSITVTSGPPGAAGRQLHHPGQGVRVRRLLGEHHDLGEGRHGHLHHAQPRAVRGHVPLSSPARDQPGQPRHPGNHRRARFQ